MKNEMSYNFIVYSELVYEFNDNEITETDIKIKKKLKYYKKGDYNQQVVNRLRLLRNDLQKELSNPLISKYYNKNSQKEFSDPTDYDFQGLLNHYSSNYIEVSEEDMIGILNISIYVYYLR